MKHRWIVVAIAALTVSVSFGQQLPVFKVDYSTDGNSMALARPRMEPPSTNAPYLRGAWALELERTTNAGATWQGIYTNSVDTLPAVGTLQDAPPVPPPGKMALTDPMLGLFVNYRAKVSPCLNCKTVVAYHFRPGWNGFTVPFTTKYLKRVMQEEWITVNNGVTNEALGSPWTAVGTINRITGAYTFSTGDSGWPGFGNITFPFSTTNAGSLPGWTVTDDHFQTITDSGFGSNPRYIHTSDVWLSGPMTLGMTEHDTQGLIDSTITNAPWGSITSVWCGSCDPATCEDSGSCESAMQDFYPVPLCPPLRLDPTDPAQKPWGVNTGAAAAGSLYVPCNWGGYPIVQDGALMVYYDQPEMYCKWGSMVRGPWGWTLTTSAFATSETHPFLTGSQSLESDCGGIINVQAPPPADGTNWCIVAVPTTPP